MLDLYILETCPYSRKVIDYFEDNDIKYNKKDITKAENLEKLIQLGGERQVPFYTILIMIYRCMSQTILLNM